LTAQQKALKQNRSYREKFRVQPLGCDLGCLGRQAKA
jgi:hypothetical protein